MKLIVERISKGSCEVEGALICEIGRGMLILFGALQGDDEDTVDRLAAKCAELRMFEDENGKMNLSVIDVGADAMVIPNFTLAANCAKGNRPNFMNAMPPKEAEKLFYRFAQQLELAGVKNVVIGQFGAHMNILSIKDGPATIMLD